MRVFAKSVSKIRVHKERFEDSSLRGAFLMRGFAKSLSKILLRYERFEGSVFARSVECTYLFYSFRKRRGNPILNSKVSFCERNWMYSVILIQL